MYPAEPTDHSAYSVQISNNGNTERRSADFPPNIWGDRFLHCAFDCKATNEEMREIEKLKEEVKRMLTDTKTIQSDKLELVDSLQRLGVSYHFEKDIEKILEQIYRSTKEQVAEKEIHGDLHSVSLWFRLLRQHGYPISSDVFNKFFKLREIDFKDSNADDVKGILSFYEATHLRKHGEDMLDEAHARAAAYLEAIVRSLNSNLKTQVSRALKQALYKGIQRVEATHFMPIYEEDPSHIETLLTFAKLDFNYLQKVHQLELSDISRWWKDLDIHNKVPYTRDRVVECYFWALGAYFEPQYHLARKLLTKVIAMSSIVDDTYDMFGTIEELQLFTEAVERWDAAAVDVLPEYMQHIFRALLSVYSEMEEAIAPDGKSYRLHYQKAAMKKQARAYFDEAKWFDEKYMPTMEEYMSLGLETSGYSYLTTTSVVGMGDMVTEETFEWISSDPKIMKASCAISRLMNDIVSHELEQKRGHIPSAVECYTNQYGVSKEEAVKVFREEISNAWKDMNEAYTRPTPVPMAVLDRILNMTRVIDVVYKDEDSYTLAALKDLITWTLIEPVQIKNVY